MALGAMPALVAPLLAAANGTPAADELADGFAEIDAMMEEQVARAKEIARLMDKQKARLEAMRSAVGGDSCAAPAGDDDKPGAATTTPVPSSTATASHASTALGAVVPTSDTARPWMRYSVARGGAAFRDLFNLAGAVQLDADVTAATALPHDTPFGMPRYVALADAVGALYVFHASDGALAARIDVSSPPDGEERPPAYVSAVHAYLKRRNETVIVAGRSDGTIAVLRAVESNTARTRPRGKQATVSHREDRPHVELTRATLLRGDDAQCAPEGSDEAVPAILGAITVVDTAKVSNGFRLLAAMDARGTVALFDEASGRVRPYAIVRATAPTVNIKLTVGASMLVMISRDGRAIGATLPRHPVSRGGQGTQGTVPAVCLVPSSTECHGINGSSISAISFETHAVSRINAVTDEGDLLWLTVAISQLQSPPKKPPKQDSEAPAVAGAFADKPNTVVQCHVRARRIGTAHAGTSALVPLKGYLLSWGTLGAALLNVTLASQKLLPDLTLAAPSAAVAAMFGGDAAAQGVAVASSNRNRFLLLSFTDGLAAWFHADLPVNKPPEFNTKAWSQPLFLVAIVLVGMYQFSQKGQGMGSAHRSSFGAGLDDMDLGAFAKGMQGLNTGGRSRPVGADPPGRFGAPPRG